MCRNVSPSVPGAHVHVRSFMFLDQQVMLTGFSGGTGEGKQYKIRVGMKWQSSEIQPEVTMDNDTSVPRFLCCKYVSWGGLSSCLRPALPVPRSCFLPATATQKSKSKLHSQLSLCIPGT